MVSSLAPLLTSASLTRLTYSTAKRQSWTSCRYIYIYIYIYVGGSRDRHTFHDRLELRLGRLHIASELNEVVLIHKFDNRDLGGIYRRVFTRFFGRRVGSLEFCAVSAMTTTQLYNTWGKKGHTEVFGPLGGSLAFNLIQHTTSGFFYCVAVGGDLVPTDNILSQPSDLKNSDRRDESGPNWSEFARTQRVCGEPRPELTL